MKKETSVPDEERDRAFETFLPLVRSIAAQFYKPNALQLEDLVQAGSEGLLNAASLKGKNLTEKYAEEAIKNSIINEISRSKRQSGARRITTPKTGQKVWEYPNSLSIDDDGLESAIPLSTDPWQGIDRALDFEKIFKKLEPCEQQILKLISEEGMTTRDAAAELKLPKSTVGDIHKRAMEKLRELLRTKPR
jgi:RNA polymerase sigma factor (sigma-70 family)